MTIQQLADAHVGHPEELGEDSVITAQRESFKWGAYHALKEIEGYVFNNCATCGLTILNKIKKLKEEL